jgi:hypothetical protein
MRENRLSGSEGGGTEPNQFLLPLSGRSNEKVGERDRPLLHIRHKAIIKLRG